MTEKTKKDNVVGIGHNQNNYSKEQYAKLVNSLHHAHLFAQEEMHRVRKLFDEAFTKRINSNPYDTKLQDFQIHERRSYAKKIASNFYSYADDKIEAIEKKAKADGIKLELPTKEDEEGASE
tara:strand:+ start:75 stop:440 length:366 start_codon:yes stop_codon:yes gene_type:complete